MIYYDSRRTRSYFQLNGSLLPKALRASLPHALIALLLKVLEQTGHLDLDDWAIMTESSIYGGFTFVLGFTLVFRTSQAYERYMSCAINMYAMRAEWFDACGSLVAFSKCSKRPEPEIATFQNRIVRLFSILHCVAVEELACLEDESFAALDMEGLDQSVLVGLHDHEGRKTKLVYQWIKMFIMLSMQQGFLAVPPPILSRVYEELHKGLLVFEEILQVSTWPFPFPYCQMAVVMIQLHLVITPFVICQWTGWHISAFFLTWLSGITMVAMDCIATEIENPLGDDVNDLPVHEMHMRLNQELLMLLNPMTWSVPRLTTDANLDLETGKEQWVSVWKHIRNAGASPDLTKSNSVHFVAGLDTQPAKMEAPKPAKICQDQHLNLLAELARVAEKERQEDLADLKAKQELLQQKLQADLQVALQRYRANSR